MLLSRKNAIAESVNEILSTMRTKTPTFIRASTHAGKILIGELPFIEIEV